MANLDTLSREGVLDEFEVFSNTLKRKPALLDLLHNPYLELSLRKPLCRLELDTQTHPTTNYRFGVVLGPTKKISTRFLIRTHGWTDIIALYFSIFCDPKNSKSLWRTSTSPTSDRPSTPKVSRLLFIPRPDNSQSQYLHQDPPIKVTSFLPKIFPPLREPSLTISPPICHFQKNSSTHFSSPILAPQPKY